MDSSRKRHPVCCHQKTWALDENRLSPDAEHKSCRVGPRETSNESCKVLAATGDTASVMGITAQSAWADVATTDTLPLSSYTL